MGKRKPIALSPSSSPSSPSMPRLDLWQLQKSAIVCGLFFTSSTILQRLSGSLLVHSGRAYPLTAAWGFICTGASLIVANRGANMAFPQPSSWWGGSRERLQRYSELRQTVVGLGLYGMLEMRSFRTAIPSSIISVGVYAHSPWIWTQKMPEVISATSEVATSAQRMAVQRLGKLHGCHHCGSRQVFNLAKLKGLPNNFIADHMPPTKYVTEANQRWYRQLLGGLWRKKQQLLPQCQSCFQQQGSAVRQSVHRIVYHSQLRSWHLAPALALVACSNDQVRGMVDDHLGSFLRGLDSELYEPALRSVQTVADAIFPPDSSRDW
jgi:hypothetical protein